MLSKYHDDASSQACLRQATLWCFLSLAMCWSANAQLIRCPLTHNGYNRPYLIFRPSHLQPGATVVFVLGGIHSTAQSEANLSGWTARAQKNGFLAVFPEPVATDPRLPNAADNVTFWEMAGSRTHILARGALPVDDDGYLQAVIQRVLKQERVDPHRVFLAGFSSGSGMVQLFASRHPHEIRGLVAVATPLMAPPARLAHPVAVLYIHGDDDEPFSGFEANSPAFATTPHGNWVTWGYLNGCTTQTAARMEWGVQFRWKGCNTNVPVIADFFAHIGHEWSGRPDAHVDAKYWLYGAPDFTEIAWDFFSSLSPRSDTATKRSGN